MVCRMNEFVNIARTQRHTEGKRRFGVKCRRFLYPVQLPAVPLTQKCPLLICVYPLGYPINIPLVLEIGPLLPKLA